MKYAGRILAGTYAAMVLLAVLYALTTQIHLRHQEIEHLLPSFVLAFVTLPLSLTLVPLDSLAPSFLMPRSFKLHFSRCAAQCRR
jgi:hypothetical protein